MSHPGGARVLDELDSRPGSSTSLLRTVVAEAIGPAGGWLSAASLVALMREVGVPAERTRTALTRLKAKGLLESEQRERGAGYRLSAEGRAQVARSERRLHHPRAMAAGDRWCVISFSVPEKDRDVRHQLRRGLSGIGCGTVSGALWICPGFLADEVEEVVAELGLDGRVTVFLVDEIRGTTPPPEAIARWFDLAGLRAAHEQFLAAHADALTSYAADPTPRTAFATWTRVLDAWRPIPYLDPGLPAFTLPEDWPGQRSIELFLRLRAALREPATSYVASVAAGAPAPAPAVVHRAAPADAGAVLTRLHLPSGHRQGIAVGPDVAPEVVAAAAEVLACAGADPQRRLATVRPRVGETRTRTEDLRWFVERYGHEYTVVAATSAEAGAAPTDAGPEAAPEAAPAPDPALVRACAAAGCALVLT
ncbi:PaaX family transcriptional regulator C-terminal domain-containing protein [Nocardioides sp. zg-DK7169]|uniref:PaaX family transcriptional regulator n=1 Tax=Nocardioides sp. zg-DK7169 TaxID=2736600 RepID=UPI001554A54A|nr:PaaX family transcriptional regulator C-terminal domain-containing protein [Nocardioides sp. zg-DK7169]NPC98722.1 hypothetical protein [Nocardioides sp. zg-DK7169]